MSGVDVVHPSGTKVKSKIMALSGHFDLPACSGVLDQVQYIGHDSCSYCDEHGEVVKSGPKGHVMTFPFHDPDSGHVKTTNWPRSGSSFTGWYPEKHKSE